MWSQERGKKIERRFDEEDVMASVYKLCFISVFIFYLISFSVPWVSATRELVMPLEVAEAEESLVMAYDAVLDAEEAGANVSNLFNKLNIGGECLAEAYASVRLGDSESAGRFAGLCVEAVDDVESEAFLLRNEAARLERADFSVKVFGSAVGVVIVVVSGVVLWEIFKRRYHENFLKLRPEVNNGEA